MYKQWCLASSLLHLVLSETGQPREEKVGWGLARPTQPQFLGWAAHRGCGVKRAGQRAKSGTLTKRLGRVLSEPARRDLAPGATPRGSWFCCRAVDGLERVDHVRCERFAKRGEREGNGSGYLTIVLFVKDGKPS